MEGVEKEDIGIVGGRGGGGSGGGGAEEAKSEMREKGGKGWGKGGTRWEVRMGHTYNIMI